MASNFWEVIDEPGKPVEGIIRALSLIVEIKDPYTARHQRRVAELAQAIAQEMHLPEWQSEGIHAAGLLHDIGKIAVPVEILSKPGPISQDEFAIVKSHPEIGFEILSKIEFPWPITQAILQHHERLDGSGYPRGLSGPDLILEARILGVADVTEAMAFYRPYRPAFGLQPAFQELAKARGVLYDTNVVDACLTLFHRGIFHFEPLPITETLAKLHI